MVAMNPYKLRYTVYKVNEDGAATPAAYCSADIAFDLQYHKHTMEKLAEGLTIFEAFQAFPELQEASHKNTRFAETRIPNDRVLENKVLELMGNRKLTMPELSTLVAPFLVSLKKSNTSTEMQVIQWLSLEKYITFQPAIQRDKHGRLFCLRCLQTDTIIDNTEDSYRCSNSEKSTGEVSSCAAPCYVCTGCAAYGEVRSCIPILSVTEKGQALSRSLPQVKEPEYPHPLSDEQREASNDICRLIEAGKNCLVWAVCGAGKTELVFQTVAHVRKRAGKVLLATPRKDVVMELLPRFTTAFTDDTVHAVYGGSTEKHIQAGITIATTHQLLRYLDDSFDLVIIDEIDAFPYAGDPMLQQHARRLSKQFIYMTATPDREILKQVKRKEIEAVILFQRHHRKPLPEPEFVRCDSLTPVGLELTVKKLFKKGKKSLVSGSFERVVKQLPKTGVVMFFVPSIFRGRELVELLQRYTLHTKQKMDTTFIHAKDPERAEKIAELRAGKYRWIVTTTILERGVTIPDSHVVVIDANHIVFTKSTLIQIAGRVGRTTENPDGKVFFIAQNMDGKIQSAMKEIKKMNRKAKKMNDERQV